MHQTLLEVVTAAFAGLPPLLGMDIISSGASLLLGVLGIVASLYAEEEDE